MITVIGELIQNNNLCKLHKCCYQEISTDAVVLLMFIIFSAPYSKGTCLSDQQFFYSSKFPAVTVIVELVIFTRFSFFGVPTGQKIFRDGELPENFKMLLNKTTPRYFRGYKIN